MTLLYNDALLDWQPPETGLIKSFLNSLLMPSKPDQTTGTDKLHVFRDNASPLYEELSQRYGVMARGIDPGLLAEEWSGIRERMSDVLVPHLEPSAQPQVDVSRGVFLTLGNCDKYAERRELDSTLLERTTLANASAFALAGFDSEDLKTGFESLIRMGVTKNIVIARREFSGLLAPRFDHFMRSLLKNRLVDGGITADTLTAVHRDLAGVTAADIKAHPLPGEGAYQSDEDPFKFSEITSRFGKIKLVVAHNVLSGMLWSTEHMYRTLITDMRELENENNQSVPTGQQVRKITDEVAQAMFDRFNKDLMRELNNQAAENVLAGIANNHPHSTIIASAETDVNFIDDQHPFGEYIRLDFDRIKAMMDTVGFQCTGMRCFTTTHNHESPRNQHNCRFFIFSPKEKPKEHRASGEQKGQEDGRAGWSSTQRATGNPQRPPPNQTRATRTSLGPRILGDFHLEQ